MNFEKFKDFFYKVIENKKNKYHPLVWINGSPIIGDGTYIGGFSEVNAKGDKVIIGKNCDIASFVVINVADSHKKTIGLKKKIQTGPIKIEDNVFIGAQSVILGNVSIGRNSVIGAGTILKNVKIPKYSLVVGNPPKIKSGYYKKNKSQKE